MRWQNISRPFEFDCEFEKRTNLVTNTQICGELKKGDETQHTDNTQQKREAVQFVSRFLWPFCLLCQKPKAALEGEKRRQREKRRKGTGKGKETRGRARRNETKQN